MNYCLRKFIDIKIIKMTEEKVSQTHKINK